MATRVSVLQARAPWIAPSDPIVHNASLSAPSEPTREGSASLFAGKSGSSLFAPVPKVVSVSVAPLRGQGPVVRLRALIARAEAGAKDYDAVQYGARIKPGGPPTALTLRQIYDWIDDTPGQPHAIGRYQFIPATLRRLVSRLGMHPETRFSPRVQDQLADVLLKEAGLHRFLAGEMERQTFMNNLAKIWAGLPNDTGRSHYHGYAGNKATMTWASFDAQMERIFPG